MKKSKASHSEMSYLKCGMYILCCPCLHVIILTSCVAADIMDENIQYVPNDIAKLIEEILSRKKLGIMHSFYDLKLHNHPSEAEAEADRLNKICESTCPSKPLTLYVRCILQ